MIIATACSSPWYPRLECLIGSLHATQTHLQQILVYDLGLSRPEREFIHRSHWCQLRQVPWVNPYVLTPYRSRQKGDPNHQYVGLMSWKPALLPDVLQDYPHALWLDAGVTAWAPLDRLWEHVQQVGHFFVGADQIDWCTTQHVRQTLKLTPEILADTGINAGLFGFSRAISSSVIQPARELARDLSLFVDDGSAPGGPTAARHEQTLLSILVAQAGLKRHTGPDITLSGGTPVRVTCNKEELDSRTILYHSRGDSRYGRKHVIARPYRTVPVPWGTVQVV